MRAVLDTNVLISAAIFPHSMPRRAVDLVCASGEMIFSAATFMELEDAFFRAKFDRYIEPLARVEYVAMLFHAATFARPTETIRVCRDPKDNQFLEAAIAGNTALIVTGDRDLRALDPFRGIRIVNPSDFLALHAPPAV
ncbi:MAG: putative toxin-antitoxin system toxin component, PIN family [Candidatus Odyssella sp.]|nr:putative toxin-antitoxin system toxin component, PIN family [Candidatus Odyssella sp.]